MASELARKRRLAQALDHPDRAGAGAQKRREVYRKNPDEKVGAVMSEFRRGTLHSGSGEKVTKRKQALAIALSEARRAGASIPEKK